jgi:phosphatidylinositol alpha-1,6-mannosyltransferase
MNRPLLICPSYFDHRLDGVGRVAGALAVALERVAGEPPFILSANDPVGSCPVETGQCFGRRYRAMMMAALSPRAAWRRPAGGSGLSRSSPPRPIVCAHLGLSPVARLLARRLRRPYSVFVHGVEAWKPLRFRQRWGLRGASRLLVNSNYTLERFLAQNPWAGRLPAVVVPLGVPVTGLAPAAAAAPSDASFTVLSVGRMAREECFEGFRDPSDLYKGFRSVVEAVALLREAGVPAVLDLVGDGNARPDLERWVATQPVARFVRFLGRVSDAELAHCYADARVFVLASEGEGFGLVFAEAMAHGLPCVAVAAGAAPEVVADDVSGYVVRARDSREIADRLLVLLRNPVVRARLSRGAALRHASLYSEARFIERLVVALGSPAVAGAGMRP